MDPGVSYYPLSQIHLCQETFHVYKNFPKALLFLPTCHTTIQITVLAREEPIKINDDDYIIIYQAIIYMCYDQFYINTYH